jgi:lipopolysaccharide transport system permease protein
MSTTKNYGQKPTSLDSLLRSIWYHRQLIISMIKREVVGRYKGSLFGLAWSFFNPILMLVIYTFVFSVVFKARWSNGDGLVLPESKTLFATVLFVGLIIYGIFAEIFTRSPTMIISNTNYVKKVVFPLEILPVIALGVALFNSAISILVLLCAFLMFNGFLYPTIIFLPLIIFPLSIFTLGLSWMLASLGVFLRDTNQIVGVTATIILFISPVFYSVSSLPELYQSWIMANPLTFIIEQARGVLIWGKFPDFMSLIIYTFFSICVAWLGYVFFQKTRDGFSDVL